MDSPGHCAQYCTYTTMENESKEIISVVTIDKRQTQRNSVIMEREAFVRTMDKLLTEIKLTEICTDAHNQISSLMSKYSSYYLLNKYIIFCLVDVDVFFLLHILASK